MNALHSLWTGTTRFRPERGPLVVHTLSLALLHEHFAHVELVTDDGGLHLAEALGWRYTAYVNVFDRLTAAGLTHVWALGKLAAALEQGEPYVQVDTDVLLWQPLRRECRQARLVAQSIDYPDYYRGTDMDAARAHAGLPDGRVAYNCGVVGGTDLRLLHAYAAEGLDLARRFRGHPLNGTTTSMAAEQYHLGDFARRHHCRVETVLPLGYDAAQRARGRGEYDHLTGDTKRDPARVGECEAVLARRYPAEYRRLLRGLARLGVGDDVAPGVGSAGVTSAGVGSAG